MLYEVITEVRGLLWGDIDFEECVINIEHNYVLLDGMKAPKAGSNRRVPLPEAVKAMLEYIRSVSMWTDSDDFVFCQPDARKTARGQHFFRYSVEVVLRDIGIPVEDRITSYNVCYTKLLRSPRSCGPQGS